MAKYLTSPPRVDATYPKGLHIKGDTQGTTFRRTGFYTPGYSYAFSTDGKTRHDMLSLTDCIIDGTYDLAGGPTNTSNKWASRNRGVMSGKSRRVWTRAWKEHDYWDIPGSYAFEECTADNHGAQGWQIVNRPVAWFPGYDPSMSGDVRFTRCFALECGQLRGQGRAAASWTLYRDWGTTLMMDCRAEHTQGDIGTGHARIVQFKGQDASLVMHGGRYSYANPAQEGINLLLGDTAQITRTKLSPNINIYIRPGMRHVLVAGAVGGDIYVPNESGTKMVLWGPVSKGINFNW